MVLFGVGRIFRKGWGLVGGPPVTGGKGYSIKGDLGPHYLPLYLLFPRHETSILLHHTLTLWLGSQRSEAMSLLSLGLEFTKL